MHFQATLGLRTLALSFTTQKPLMLRHGRFCVERFKRTYNKMLCLVLPGLSSRKGQDESFKVCD